MPGSHFLHQLSHIAGVSYAMDRVCTIRVCVFVCVFVYVCFGGVVVFLRFPVPAFVCFSLCIHLLLCVP